MPARLPNDRSQWRAACTCAIVVLLAAGCATPVGVQRLSTREAGRRLTESVLGGDTVSAPTMQMLNRAGLAETFRETPAGAISRLHAAEQSVRSPDRQFALAELCFLQGLRSNDRSYYRAAAVYAYAFLFPRGGTPPEPFDPRLRTAVDLYNQGLAEGFTDAGGRHVVLEAGRYALPFGELVVRVDPAEFRWGPFRLTDFVAADQFAVRGLTNDYRWPGIGTALVAALKHVKGESEAAFTLVPSSLKMAATAFLRFDDVQSGIATGRVDGALELFTTLEAPAVEVEGRRVPLEIRPTAALAYTLEGSDVYSLELKALFSGDLAILKQSPRFKDNVFLMGPYRPGRIPLVLVHGTASSPARWAQLLNEIINDRELCDRYQIWLFTYNTGNPILYSAGVLASGLRNVVHRLDPDGSDPALRRMVIVGHSQGGMLTKLTAVDSGTAFWDATFSVPLDRLNVSPETREQLRRSLFYEPLPFVQRVVFIATPHHGSFLIGERVRLLLQRVITLPFAVLSPIQEVIDRSPEAVAKRGISADVPRSTDNMNPDSRFVQTYSQLPIAPAVTAHSIIAVKNPLDPQPEWNDGVVAYTSAHIDGVASELIVHSGHSTQETSPTIEEVRRILLENLQTPPAEGRP
jgi:pimeloyl-ACP methyl ester carboxylesterase